MPVHQSSVDWALGMRPLQNGVLVARTLFGDERNVKVARILNYSEEPFEFDTGDLVGYAEPVMVPPSSEPTQGSSGNGPMKDREGKVTQPNASQQRKRAMRVKKEGQEHVPVSYTHLTLPTKRIV